MSDDNMGDVGFDYTRVRDRQGPLSRYLIEEVPELLGVAHELRELHRLLSDRCDGRDFRGLQENHDYRPVLLGGITDQGEYAENSYAKLFERLFGLRWKDPDTAIANARAGITIDEEVIVEETELTRLLDDIIRHGSAIVESVTDTMAGWEPTSEPLPEREDWTVTVDDSDVDAIIDNPDELVDRLQQFLNAMQAVLPNHDERALFIWTLDYAPRFYLESSYPALSTPIDEAGESEETLLSQYEQFLGLTPIFQPNLSSNDEETRRDFSIYAFSEDSIGRRLLSIYSALWDAFEESDDEMMSVRTGFEIAFPELPDPKQSFLERAEGALEELNDYTPPENLDELRIVDTTEEELEAHKEEYRRRKDDGLVTFPSVHATHEAEYEISGGILTTCDYDRWGHSTSGNEIIDNDVEEASIPLPNVFRELAPALFLLHGIEYRLDIDEKRMELTQL